MGKVGADRGQTPPLVGKLSSSLPERLFGGEQSGNGARSLENEVSEVWSFFNVGGAEVVVPVWGVGKWVFLRREAAEVVTNLVANGRKR